MTTEEQSENKQVYINELIFNKLGQTAKILKKLDTTNNDVYIISSNNKEYILKFYKNRTWPEDGKNLYVNSLLEKNNIPFAKVVAYTRDCDFSDGGYILEEKIKGGSVNMDKLSTNEGEEYYSLLAKFIKKVHQIKFDNFGYINNGKPLYSNFYEFLKDDLEDHSKLLIENNLISQEDLKRIQKHFKDVFANGNFKPCLCHGDLSLRNAIVYNNKLVLIDYDDSMVLPAFADIARMTFDMRPYKAYLSWRQAFLNSYFQDIDKFKTYENFEKTYHIYCAIDWIDFALKKGYDYTNLYDYLKTLLSSID